MAIPQRMNADTLLNRKASVERNGQTGAWLVTRPRVYGTGSEVLTDGADSEQSAMLTGRKADALCSLMQKDRRQRRAARKPSVNRKEMKKAEKVKWQLFIAAQSPEFCSMMAEHMKTLAFLTHMTVYLMDEMDGAFDELVSRRFQNKLKSFLEAKDELLDVLYECRITGEDTEGYNEVAAEALDFVPMVNTMINFGRAYAGGEGSWRVREMQKVMERVFPEGLIADMRREAGERMRENICQMLVDYENGTLTAERPKK